MTRKSLTCDAEATQAHADAIIEALRSNAGFTVTWLNHFSAQRAFDSAHSAALEAVDVVGVDGKLLQLLVAAPARTSADCVLPVVFESHVALRIALIGGTSVAAVDHANAVRKRINDMSEVVLSVDGYESTNSLDALADACGQARANLIIVGLSAGRQEQVAVTLSRRLPTAVVVTCGGFLDQLEYEHYYPGWAYPLRLNWLVRLAREPRRLWRRYTIDGARAVLRRRELAEKIHALPGYGGVSGASAEVSDAPLAA